MQEYSCVHANKTFITEPNAPMFLCMVTYSPTLRRTWSTRHRHHRRFWNIVINIHVITVISRKHKGRFTLLGSYGKTSTAEGQTASRAVYEEGGNILQHMQICRIKESRARAW